jgi:hypothetical protein
MTLNLLNCVIELHPIEIALALVILFKVFR